MIWISVKAEQQAIPYMMNAAVSAVYHFLHGQWGPKPNTYSPTGTIGHRATNTHSTHTHIADVTKTVVFLQCLLDVNTVLWLHFSSARLKVKSGQK